MTEKEIFKQDLSQEERPGAVFIIKLLMKEPAALPDRERMVSVMERRLGPVDCFWHDEKGAGFAAKNYLAQFKDAALPPQLMVTQRCV